METLLGKPAEELDQHHVLVEERISLSQAINVGSPSKVRYERSEEAVSGAQYNVLVAQFAAGHTTAQGSIVNLTATNATQQQNIATLQMKYHRVPIPQDRYCIVHLYSNP